MVRWGTHVESVRRVPQPPICSTFSGEASISLQIILIVCDLDFGFRNQELEMSLKALNIVYIQN